MGKISPVSIKYIIHANMELTGVAEKPDIIGAIFGQTEGLLGSDLELRELQKSGRIGRIDVKIENKGGKTYGEILLPSSMGKTETAIIAAALETIERVGPCDSKIKITNIEDVRLSKRDFILERAKALLHDLVTNLPDSQAFTDVLAKDVRGLEITEYGPDRLPAGPAVDESEDIIIVEGRADVLNLLRYGIRNAIALKGTKVTDTIVELSKRKVTTLFVDGDRGGDLIIKKLADLTDVDFVAHAPDGKEVEELTQKEILKSLRLKIAWEQVKAELNGVSLLSQRQIATTAVAEVSPEFSLRKDLKQMKHMAEEIIGTKGAFVLDENLNILGRVPVKELEDTLQNMSEGVFAVIMDGQIDQRLAKIAEDKDVKYLVAQSSPVKSYKTRIMSLESL